MGVLCLSSCNFLSQTRKIKSLFNLKDQTWHKSNVIYRAECTCGETPLGKQKRNSAVRNAEHEKKSYNSKPARHVVNHTTHAYKHGTLRAPREKLLKASLLLTNPKQTSKFFHCETFPLGNTLIERNQVERSKRFGLFKRF